MSTRCLRARWFGRRRHPNSEKPSSADARWGGALLIGIEDDAEAPAADQRVEPALLDRIRKRVGELTVNVQVVPELERHENGGEYISLTIPGATDISSTSDGRYFLRVGDTCQPIVGDDVTRLANERPATPCEEMTSLRVPRATSCPMACCARSCRLTTSSSSASCSSTRSSTGPTRSGATST